MNIYEIGSWLTKDGHQVYMLTTDKMFEELRETNQLVEDIDMITVKVENDLVEWAKNQTNKRLQWILNSIFGMLSEQTARNY